MNWFKRIWSFAALILAFSFLTAVSLSSCQSQNGDDKEDTEQTEGDTMQTGESDQPEGEVEQEEGDHPEGEGDHPTSEEDTGSEHPE